MSDDVAIVDAKTYRVVGRLKVGKRPWGIALTR
jgi:YVTN family beta-propeller protein